MNADEIVKALRNCGGGPEGMKITRAAADLIESLQAQLAASQRREKAAVEDMIHTIHNCKLSKCCDMAHATSPKHDTCFTCSLWEWRGLAEKGENNA